LLLFYDVKFLLLRNCVDRSGHWLIVNIQGIGRY
jgi:hypothetical protein